MRKRMRRVFVTLLAGVTAVSMLPVNSVAVYGFTGYNNLMPGSYVGSAEGYGGTLTLNATVGENKDLINIEVISNQETAAYYDRGSQVIEQIIEKQSADVDAISGATYTSEAIKNAVKDALQKAVSGFSRGTGTQADPYRISREAGLRYLQSQVAAGNTYEGYFFKVDTDIALTGTWTPIGSTTTPFAGTFDGGNKTISGLSIQGNVPYAGLFGYAVSGAHFENIVLKDVDINVSGMTAVSYGGAVVASLKNDNSGATISVVDHCKASGAIQVATENKAAMVGALVGMSNQNAALTNNTSTVDVTLSTGTMAGNVGGLVGMASVKPLIMNNKITGTVTMNSTNANANAGGIAGTFNGIGYNNVYAGVVTGTDGTVRIGGIAGNFATNAYLKNSYYTTETAFGTGSGKYEEISVQKVTGDVLQDSEFALILHDNLKSNAIAQMSTAVAQAGIAGCDDFAALQDRVESKFYDWTMTDHTLALSDKLWASTEYDAAIFASGTGTAEDPYVLQTEEQLRKFAVSLNDTLDYSGLYLSLDQDIDVSSESWIPVGNGDYAFQGTLEGNGHSITGVKIGSSEAPYQDAGQTYYGLFGVLGASAVVHNLTVDVDIHVQSDVSIYVGGLAGYIEKSHIDQVTVKGTLWGRSGMVKTAANHFSGGFAGMALRAVITNCVSNADVYGEAAGGVGEAGGILGLNNRSLTANCMATGVISGTADRKLEGMAALGGIAGVHAGTMVNCVSSASQKAERYSQYVGALAGWTTGIGELYDNYYDSTAMQTVEETKVSPVESIGWLVGPGVNDEGEAYSGGVEYQSVGLLAEDMRPASLAEKMNASFQEFPVDLTTFSGATLRNWMVENETVYPFGTEATVTYKKPDITTETEETTYTGIFYGRSTDKKVIVRLTVENSVVKSAEEVENLTGSDLTALLASVVTNNGTSALVADDEVTVDVKAAVETALTKMTKNDTTGYGVVDASIFAGGDGSKENPYQIATVEQMVAFGSSLTEDESYSGKYVILTQDITLSGTWTPAGTDSHYPFEGVFNGNGHVIRGLQIGTSEEAAEIQYAGLFAYIKGGSVVNLTIESPEIYVQKKDSSRIYAGALASFVDQLGSTGYFDQCKVTDGTIQVTSASGAAYGGGLFGSAQYGTITNSTVNANVKVISFGERCYGGVLTGIFARMGVINNSVSGMVTADTSLNKAAIGGLAGFHSGASYNNVADVKLTSLGTTTDVGALAGRNTGIGMMLEGFFNREKTQLNGAVTLEPVGVGVKVTGERDGMGVIDNLTPQTSAQLNSAATIQRLNENVQEGNANLARITSLLSASWNITMPEGVELNTWTSGTSIPVIRASVADDSDDNDDNKDDGDNNQNQDEEEKPVVTVTKPGKVAVKKAVSTSYSSVKLTWSKVKNATGYQIYRATSKGGSYKLVKTISKNTTISYTDQKLTTGKTYYYKVRAYVKSGSKKVYGSNSKICSAKPVPAATTSLTVKRASSTKAKLQWKKVAGASGYVVYRSSSKNGTYTAVKSLTSAKKLTYTDTKVKKGKAYYYKVRAYRVVKGKRVYGAYSAIKKVAKK